MPAPIVLKITLDDAGVVTGLEQVGQKMEGLGRSGEKTKGGFDSFISGAVNLKSAIDVIGGALNEATGMVMGFYNAGQALTSAKTALDAFTGGHAEQYIGAMSKATHGLVDDFTLATNANKMLGLHLVQSAEQAAQLARAGQVLGQVFKGSAAEGVETLTVAMTRVGLVGLLDNIGISGERVKKTFEELKKVMPESDAWKAAVLQEASASVATLGGAADKAESGVARLNTALDNLKAKAGQNIKIGIDAIINAGFAVGDKIATDEGNRRDKVGGAIAGQAATGGKLDFWDRLFQATGIYVGDSDMIGKKQNTFGANDRPGRTHLDPEVLESLKSYWTQWFTQSLPNTLNDPSSVLHTMQGLGGPSSYGMNNNAPQSWLAPFNRLSNAGAAMMEQDRQRMLGLSGMYGGGAEYNIMGDGSRGSFSQGQYGQGGDGAVIGLNSIKSAINSIGQAYSGAVDEGKRLLSLIGDQVAAAKNYQTVKEAFGVGKDGNYSGIGAEVGSGLDSALGTWADLQRKRIGTSQYGTPGFTPDMKAFNAQQSREAEQFRYDHMQDKTYSAEHKQFEYDQLGKKIAYEGSGKAGTAYGPVYKKSDYESELADNKTALDNYAMLTGQATAKSLAFRNATDDVYKNLAAGKVTFADATKQLYEYAEAARTSGAEANILGLTIKNSLMASGAYTPESAQERNDRLTLNRALKARGMGDGFGAESEFDFYGRKMQQMNDPQFKDLGAEKESNPFQPLIQQADAAKAHVVAIGTVNLASLMEKPIQNAANTLKPIQTEAQKAAKDIENIALQLRNMVGALTIQVSYSGGSSTSNLGSNGARRASGTSF